MTQEGISVVLRKTPIIQRTWRFTQTLRPSVLIPLGRSLIHCSSSFKGLSSFEPNYKQRIPQPELAMMRQAAAGIDYSRLQLQRNTVNAAYKPAAADLMVLRQQRDVLR
jgi:hypothetical protein